jgi:membrane protein DedA with SNARE-associated domain
VDASAGFLVTHGYWLLFGLVLGEQLGLPLVGAPVLLAAGALAATGHLPALPVLALPILACLIGDTVWYGLGRRRGGSVLGFLCRVALEPDSCVRRTEDTFARRGPAVLLVAKFVPGLNTVAAPLAGITGLSLPRFLAWDAAGAALWVGAYGGVGYLFGRELERVGQWLARLGTGAAVVLAAALGLYIAWKWVQRYRFIRSLRVARITPEDLRRRLLTGESVLIVDLRSEVHQDGLRLPGALRLRPDELDHRHPEIARDREIVLYCS